MQSIKEREKNENITRIIQFALSKPKTKAIVNSYFYAFFVCQTERWLC